MINSFPRTSRHRIAVEIGRFPPPGGFRGSEVPLKLQAIEGAQALHLGEGAAHPLGDPLPLRQSSRFPKDDPQQDRGIAR